MNTTRTAQPAARRPLTELMDRQPPFDLQAEIGVLGSIILLPRLLDDVALILRPADFYDDAHGKIFSHLKAMHDAGGRIDDTLLVSRLKKSGDFEAIGGSAYLAKVVNAVPNAAHASYYAQIVRQKSEFRGLIYGLTVALRDAYDESHDPHEITSALQGDLANLAHYERRSRSVGEIAGDVTTELDRPPEANGRGVFSGVQVLDEALGPVMPGEVAVIAARTNCGKTSLAVQWAEHVATKRLSALVVSLEMGESELVTRLLCSRASVDARDLRGRTLTESNRRAIADAAVNVGALPLQIWSPAAATLADIRAVARQTKAASGLALLVVDYIGLVRPDDRRLPRYEQVSAISAGLKSMAKDLEVPIIALAQLNREADLAEPKLSHLRESGSIEQDADIVLLIHHPPVSGPAAGGDVYARGCHVIVAKHRHGETGRVALLWHPKETRFSSPLVTISLADR